MWYGPNGSDWLLKINLDILLSDDGIRIAILLTIFFFAYTGEFKVFNDSVCSISDITIDSDLCQLEMRYNIMDSIIVSNRFNYTVLTEHCENLLISHYDNEISATMDDIEYYLDFSRFYNLIRLEKRCMESKLLY